jgi:hypothetical protein
VASLMVGCAMAAAPQPRTDPVGDLRSHVEQATGPRPADCGQHRLVRSDALERSLACAREAAALRTPFWTFAQRQGIDSWLAEGLYGGSDGLVHRFLYDSAPCGGPGCASSFTAVRCDNPVVIVGQDAIARYRCGSNPR